MIRGKLGLRVRILNRADSKLSEVLYNINTGKGTTEEIRESLLNVPTKGKARHKEFIQACESDPNKFESPIKKEKLKTSEIE